MAKKKKATRPFRESGGGKYVPPPMPSLGGGSKKTTKSSGGVSTAQLGAALAAAPPPVPNIDQILASDPGYIASHAQYMANSIADQATRDAAVKRAIIDFGGSANVDPALQGLLDPTTLALAQKNTDAGMSVLARLAQAGKDQQKRVVDSLGARGLYNSGETGYDLGRAQLQADQGRYDATKNLLDYLSGVQSAWVQTQQQQALLDAQNAANAAQNAPPGVGITPDYGGIGNYPSLPAGSSGQLPQVNTQSVLSAILKPPKSTKYATYKSAGKPVTSYKGGV